MAKKNKQTSQNFLQGSLVLLIAMGIGKVIGALFKLPLTNMLGEIGIGYFTLAYNFFVIFQTIAVAGFPSAIARMVASSVAQKRYRDVNRIYNVALKIFLVTGTVCTVAMFIGSFIYANVFLKNVNYLPALLVMCPCVFFCCMMSVNRGYFQGLRNMKPTAYSQVIEALCKLLLGLFFASSIIKIGMNQYAETGVVFGTPVTNPEDANIATLPYASAAAILAVTIGTMVGTAFLMFRKRRSRNEITHEMITASPLPAPDRMIFKGLLALAIPVALAALANNLSTLIDTFTIQGSLKSLIENSPDKMQQYYGKYVELGGDMLTFIWGAYSGLAMTMFNLVPTLTSSFGVSALPAVTSSWAVGDTKETKKSIESILRITTLVGVPCGLGLTVLANEILSLLFSRTPGGVEVATPILQILGITVIVVALATPIHAILQAIGKASFIVKALLITAVIKFLFNYFLVSVPEFNINAAPIGTFVSYVFLIGADLMCLRSTTGIKINKFSVFVKPLIAGIICAASAWVVNFGLKRVIGDRVIEIAGRNVTGIICVAGAIIAAVIVYIIAVLLIRAITKDDVVMLPKGEKLAAFLEKRHLLG